MRPLCPDKVIRYDRWNYIASCSAIGQPLDSLNRIWIPTKASYCQIRRSNSRCTSWYIGSFVIRNPLLPWPLENKDSNLFLQKNQRMLTPWLSELIPDFFNWLYTNQKVSLLGKADFSESDKSGQIIRNHSWESER